LGSASARKEQAARPPNAQIAPLGGLARQADEFEMLRHSVVLGAARDRPNLAPEKTHSLGSHSDLRS
jgi:hypothetical protein